MIEQHTLEAEPGTRDSVGWVAQGQGRVPVRGSKGMGGGKRDKAGVWAAWREAEGDTSDR